MDIEQALDRVLAKQSASEVGDWAAALMQKALDRSVSETRKYLGRELVGLAKGPAGAIERLMRENRPGWDGVTDEFRAGMLFVAQLVGDERFEF